jgi:hypothetical protein
MEVPSVQFVQSKRSILKVMFLCAVARPLDGFNGLIGIWPVVEPYATQRRSVHRDAGVTILKPDKMDREKSREMMIEKVIPAIKEKWPTADGDMEILIQQDSAKPHVLPNMTARTTSGSAISGKKLSSASMNSRCLSPATPTRTSTPSNFWWRTRDQPQGPW